MDIEYPGFGRIVVGGESYDHDIVLDGGQLRARDKGPSRHMKEQFGHTPLSSAEDIPWSTSTLVVGTGYSGRLPVLPEIEQEADDRGVDLVVMPTAEAVDLLAGPDQSEVHAVLHVTC